MMIFSFLFFSFTSLAANSNCSTTIRATETKRVSIPDGINYFLRSSPTSKVVGFAGEGASNDNKLLDLKTGKISSVPGYYDPVPSPDGVLMATPEAGGMAFYLLNHKNPDSSYNSAYFDSDVRENYQSLGVLKKGKKTIYRMLYEGRTSMMLKEYSVDEKNLAVTPLGDAKPLCGSATGLNSVLPMISKDGKMFSAYDPKSGTTKIYDIDNCHLLSEVPSLVGKVDFSPNGKLLAFHVDPQADLDHIGVFQEATEDSNLSVYLYDRSSKKMIRLKSDKNANLYYPVFLSDNQIAYISKGKESDSPFSIVVAQLQTSQTGSCQPASPAKGSAAGPAHGVQ